MSNHTVTSELVNSASWVNIKLWLDVDSPIPMALQQWGVVAASAPSPLSITQPSLYFVPQHRSLSIVSVAQLRKQIGDQSALIVVAFTPISASELSTLLTLDIDEILQPDDFNKGHLLFFRLNQLAHLKLQAALAQALKKRWTFVQAALDSVPVPLSFKDSEGIFVGCNAAYEAFSGRTREQVIGSTNFDWLPREEAIDYQLKDQEIMRRSTPLVFQHKTHDAQGKPVDIEFHKSNLKDDKGNLIGLVTIMFDITERVELQDRLTQMAECDPLTGCYNRRKFFQIAENLMTMIGKNITTLSVVVLDLDHFKDVNDTYGHATGDRVLKVFAATAKACLSTDQYLARVGGEEFFVLLPNTVLQEAVCVADRIRQALSAAAIESDHDAVHVTVSGGAAEILASNENFENLLGRADAALYEAKSQGRNRIVISPSNVAYGKALKGVTVRKRKEKSGTNS